MTATLDKVIDCDSKWKAAVAGFGVAFVGFDNIFGFGPTSWVEIGIPAAVHWGLAGASVDNYCKTGNLIPMSWNETKAVAYAGMAGVGGGFAGVMAQGLLFGR